MATDKPQPEKIFCLFHQKTDCSCISPVTDNKTLIERLRHHIRLNEILNRHESDEKKKDERHQQSVLFENRLSDLEKS